MRLELFSVKNFRSISNAEKLPLGEFTVLLGPNNEGKSNILQAMVIGMEELSINRGRGNVDPSRARFARRRPERAAGGYDWERDFPQSLQGTNPEGKTTMHFDFRLTDDEVEEFYQTVGSRLNGALPITLTFGHRVRPSFAVRKPRHAAALTAKRPEIADFLADRVDIQYVKAVRTGAGAAEIVGTMLRRELQAASEANPELADAMAKVRAIQQPVFDDVATAITENLQQLLPDVTKVTIDPGDEGLAPNQPGRGLSVVVDDGTPTDLNLKGDGVQSLAALAMTQHYGRQTARAREFILAVEEPEAHLHPRAIHGLRETLRETASNQQVIITTHSAVFANRLDLSSNIIVRKNRAAPAKTVSDLRDALGVRSADNLASAEVVLVVEGTTDATAMRPLLANRSPVLEKALDDGLFTITALHGGGKLNYLVSQLKDSLASIHAFLDDDEAGRLAATTARDEGLMTPADLTLASCLGAKESEIEDLVDPACYAEVFLANFGVQTTNPWMTKMSKGKWSKRMCFVFGASGAIWDAKVEMEAKNLVAHAVAALPDQAIKPSCAGVIASLVETLEYKLRQRGA